MVAVREPICMPVMPSRCDMAHSTPPPASRSWRAITPDRSAARTEDSRVERRLNATAMMPNRNRLGWEVPVERACSGVLDLCCTNGTSGMNVLAAGAPDIVDRVTANSRVSSCGGGDTSSHIVAGTRPCRCAVCDAPRSRIRILSTARCDLFTAHKARHRSCYSPRSQARAAARFATTALQRDDVVSPMQAHPTIRSVRCRWRQETVDKVARAAALCSLGHKVRSPKH